MMFYYNVLSLVQDYKPSSQYRTFVDVNNRNDLGSDSPGPAKYNALKITQKIYGASFGKSTRNTNLDRPKTFLRPGLYNDNSLSLRPNTPNPEHLNV